MRRAADRRRREPVADDPVDAARDPLAEHAEHRRDALLDREEDAGRGDRPDERAPVVASPSRPATAPGSRPMTTLVAITNPTGASPTTRLQAIVAAPRAACPPAAAAARSRRATGRGRARTRPPTSPPPPCRKPTAAGTPAACARPGQPCRSSRPHPGTGRRDAAPGHVLGLRHQRRDDRNLDRAHPVAAGPPRRLEGDARAVPAVHGRRRADLDAADRPHPRPPLERLGDTCRHARLLPDAAAAAAGDEPVHARRDPVRVRGEQRRDGRLDERARRRRRARAAEADHVVAARRLERRRLRRPRAWSRSPARRESTRGWRACSSASRSGSPRSGSRAGWAARRPTPRRARASRCPRARCC